MKYRIRNTNHTGNGITFLHLNRINYEFQSNMGMLGGDLVGNVGVVEVKIRGGRG